MRSIKQTTVDLPHGAETAFAAALGVVQNAKNHRILAVHNEGHRLVVRETPKMSNPKFLQVLVEPVGEQSRLHAVAGTDPRTPKALLDGRANDKFLKGYLEDVQAALSGSVPAPVAPVANHYLHGTTEVPWEDPTTDPDIELDGNFRAFFAL